MNKRIKKKKVTGLQNKVKRIIKDRKLMITVTPKSKDLTTQQIFELKKMFDSIDVKLKLE
jgi:hypothetical protein